MFRAQKAAKNAEQAAKRVEFLASVQFCSIPGPRLAEAEEAAKAGKKRIRHCEEQLQHFGKTLGEQIIEKLLMGGELVVSTEESTLQAVVEAAEKAAKETAKAKEEVRERLAEKTSGGGSRSEKDTMALQTVVEEAAQAENIAKKALLQAKQGQRQVLALRENAEKEAVQQLCLQEERTMEEKAEGVAKEKVFWTTLWVTLGSRLTEIERAAKKGKKAVLRAEVTALEILSSQTSHTKEELTEAMQSTATEIQITVQEVESATEEAENALKEAATQVGRAAGKATLAAAWAASLAALSGAGWLLPSNEGGCSMVEAKAKEAEAKVAVAKATLAAEAAKVAVKRLPSCLIWQWQLAEEFRGTANRP